MTPSRAETSHQKRDISSAVAPDIPVNSAYFPPTMLTTPLAGDNLEKSSPSVIQQADNSPLGIPNIAAFNNPQPETPSEDQSYVERIMAAARRPVSEFWYADPMLMNNPGTSEHTSRLSPTNISSSGNSLNVWATAPPDGTTNYMAYFHDPLTADFVVNPDAQMEWY